MVTALAVTYVRRLLPELTALRREYIESVQNLAGVENQMRASGATEEEIARTLVAGRNAFKELARDKMRTALVRLIELRNLEKYGDVVGPTAEQLYAKYGSWSAVSAPAQRTNDFVDYVLNVCDKFL